VRPKAPEWDGHGASAALYCRFVPEPAPVTTDFTGKVVPGVIGLRLMRALSIREPFVELA